MSQFNSKKKKDIESGIKACLTGRVVSCDIQSHTSSLASFVFRAAVELYQALSFVGRHKKAVTVFGSARESLPAYYYESCEKITKDLSSQGYTIITGGGRGIMRSANKGAFETGGDSLGVTIDLPAAEIRNSFLTKHKMMRYFFTRKTALSYASQIYFFFPGGYGTLDELFEMVVLIQTHKIPRIPVILFGKEFWTPFDKFVQENLIRTYKTIDEYDDSIYTIIDTVDDALAYVKHVENVTEQEIQNNKSDGSIE